MQIGDLEPEGKKEVKKKCCDGVMIVDKRLETVKVGAVVSEAMKTYFQTCYLSSSVLSTVVIAWLLWRVCGGSVSNLCLLQLTLLTCTLAVVGADTHSMVLCIIVSYPQASLPWTLILTLLAWLLVLLPQTS